MINKNITEIVKQVSQKFDPGKIILFGSHAYGRPTNESDVDLLVIMNYSGQSRQQAALILTTIDYHFALDLIVRSSKQIKERVEAGDSFLKDVISKGKVLYERNPS